MLETSKSSGLSGIKVLDFTWAGAGPFATEQLRRLGAEVVKVESASKPDLLRVANIAYNWGPGGLESNSCFNDINAGKKSISLDLKTPAGRNIALRLAKEADVVCDNMRPGKMEALGLGYEALKAINPKVICCSVSAIGRVDMPGGDPQPDVPGYAPVFWAEGGGASVTGLAGEEPAYFRAPTDMNAAAFFTVGILAALFARERSGKGCRVDCSAIETVVACVGDEVLASSLGITAGGLRGNYRPPYLLNDTFPCVGNDSWIAISVSDGQQWDRLCDVLAPTDLKFRAIGADKMNALSQMQLYDKVAELTSGWKANELSKALSAAGLATSECSTLGDLLNDPHLVQRGFWQNVTHPILGDQTVGGLPFNMSPPLAGHNSGGPMLGQHTVSILQDWLDMPDGEILDSQQSGAFEGFVVGELATEGGK